jgi:hypothetical protein
MDGIDLPRRQFLGQSGALVASATVLNSLLPTQVFAAQPGEEIIPWSDQPSADPGVARGVIQNLQRWEDLDWLTLNSRFFNIAHYNRPHIDEQDWSLEITVRAIGADGSVQPAPTDPQITGKHTYWESNGQTTRHIRLS